MSRIPMIEVVAQIAMKRLDPTGPPVAAREKVCAALINHFSVLGAEREEVERAISQAIVAGVVLQAPGGLLRLP